MPEIEVVVGVLGRAHGVTGEIALHLRTDSPDLRLQPGAVLWTDGGRALTVRGWRRQGVRAVVRFEGVDDRTQAETLTGQRLTARVDAGESTGEDDVWFDHQLVGLDVVTDSGDVVGVVTRIEHLGFQDMIVVDVRGSERMVPFVGELVPEIRLGARQVVVKAIPGLLEDA